MAYIGGTQTGQVNLDVSLYYTFNISELTLTIK
jgi:hypothetical protein